MSNTKAERRHPKHSLIAKLLRDGMYHREIRMLLKVSQTTVTAVRTAEGIPVPPRTHGTVQQKLRDGIQSVSGTDHTTWAGYTNHGTPVIRHRGSEVSAAALIFEARAGRKPVGRVSSECDGHPQCMTGTHLMDHTERQALRRQMQSLLGLPGPAAECFAGHDQRVHGAVEPDLTNYCATCNADRSAKRRKRNS